MRQSDGSRYRQALHTWPAFGDFVQKHLVETGVWSRKVFEPESVFKPLRLAFLREIFLGPGSNKVGTQVHYSPLYCPSPPVHPPKAERS